MRSYVRMLELFDHVLRLRRTAVIHIIFCGDDDAANNLTVYSQSRVL
jgi:hypothetical protein